MRNLNLLFTLISAIFLGTDSNVEQESPPLVKYNVEQPDNLEIEACTWENCKYNSMNLNKVVLESGRRVRPFYVMGDNILVVTRALIIDNAEIGPNIRGKLFKTFGHSYEAILSIKILGSYDKVNWTDVHWVPLPGMHYTGDEGKGPYKGYPKLEWLDCEGLDYQNFGILDWDSFHYKYIRFQIREGDIFQADDILLDIYYTANDLKYSNSEIGVWGNNYHHAKIWVKTVNYNPYNRITPQYTVTCPKCKGTGEIERSINQWITKKVSCPKCGGDGSINY